MQHSLVEHDAQAKGADGVRASGPADWHLRNTQYLHGSGHNMRYS
jgi:hypothetical protein